MKAKAVMVAPMRKKGFSINAAISEMKLTAPNQRGNSTEMRLLDLRDIRIRLAWVFRRALGDPSNQQHKQRDEPSNAGNERQEPKTMQREKDRHAGHTKARRCRC